MQSNRIALTLLLLMLFPQVALALPRPPAGGANQLDAAEGTVNQTLFNGEVRLRVTAVRAATDAERDELAPADEQKIIVVTGTLSNGTHDTFNGVFEFALADVDGVVVSAESRYIEPNPPPDAPPGGAWHETVSFLVPKDYKPTKLVVTQSVKSHEGDAAKAFRIRIDPSTIR